MKKHRLHHVEALQSPVFEILLGFLSSQFLEQQPGGISLPEERRAVAGDEHLAVLVRGHRAGIDVQIGIELLDDDGDAVGLEEPTESGGGDPLPYGTHHTASDENVLRHVIHSHHTGGGKGLSSIEEARGN